MVTKHYSVACASVLGIWEYNWLPQFTHTLLGWSMEVDTNEKSVWFYGGYERTLENNSRRCQEILYAFCDLLRFQAS